MLTVPWRAYLRATRDVLSPAAAVYIAAGPQPEPWLFRVLAGALVLTLVRERARVHAARVDA